MLVGRQRETEAIETLLAAACAGSSGALVLRGEPGAGKTALLRHAVAQAPSMLVLRATGFESEAELEFSGLVEVCRPLVGSLDSLPGVQAAALSSAVGLVEATADNRFSVAAATLGLIAGTAESTPVLVVVDDAHWLDGASLDALLFAARRLTIDPVAFLFATRPEGLIRSGLAELELKGLDAGAAATLVARSVGVPVAAGVLESLLDATAGNPLGLIELPAGLSAEQLAGRDPILAPLLASGAVERAFAGRLAALSHDARRTAAVVAASDGGSAGPVRAALSGLRLPESALGECEDARMVTVLGDRFSFAHPLLRAAAYQSVEPSFRRAAHQALAAAIGEQDIERWAWHLALGAVAPDDEAAAALARAAGLASSKHAHAAAAAGFERAAALTSDPARRASLLLDAAEAAWTSGAPGRALDLAESLLGEDLDRDERVRALRVAGRVELQVGVSSRSLELLLAALELCGDDEPDRAANIVYFACLALWMQGRIEEQVALARRGVELAPPGTTSGDTITGYMLGQALTMAGRSGDAREWLERALAAFLRQRPSGIPVDERRATFCLSFLGRLGEAAVVGERALQRGRGEGPLQALWALMTLARTVLQLGDWDRAVGLSTEAVELAAALDQPATTAEMSLLLARIAAARGDEERCRLLIDQTVDQAKRSANALNEQDAQWSLGRVALANDRLEDAVAILAGCAQAVAGMALLAPELAPEPDLVEALVRLGRTDDARSVLDRWTGRGAELATSWSPPLIAACRALVAEDGSFEGLFDEALRLHAELADPYLEARTRLLYGERLRRAGRRVAAREQLRSAHGAFTTLGCTAWAARASRELRASGERLRSAASSGDELTPQEREIALQVAAGKQNKEVAAALFLSPKTVEFHLSRIYRKLGIGSRTELVRLFATAG